MTDVVVLAYFGTIAGGAVAALALFDSGQWRQARMLLALIAAAATIDMAMLLWPEYLWTPTVGIGRELLTAFLAAGYAVEVATRLPPRPAALARHALMVVAVATLGYLIGGWTVDTRAVYRAVALVDAGAGAALGVVLVAALVHEVALAAVTRRALFLLFVCLLTSAAATAPFEWWWPAAHIAQLGAAGLYVLAMLMTARSAWSPWATQ